MGLLGSNSGLDDVSNCAESVLNRKFQVSLAALLIKNRPQKNKPKTLHTHTLYNVHLNIKKKKLDLYDKNIYSSIFLP